jgi:O-antigen/teichoic acid export membrane protein
MTANQSALRTRRLKLALLTSLAGKGIASIVQIVALPIAINALGQGRFGAYAMLAAILNWMNIVGVTIGPGLTIQLVAANARMDREAEARSFGSALAISCVFAILLLIGAQVSFHAVGAERLFGAAFMPFAGELRNGVVVLCIFVSANLIVNVAEAAQAAYQKQYIHNAFLAAGNIVTIVTIAVLVRARPTIASMVIAVYSGPLLARICSLAQLLYSRRHLIGGLRRVDRHALMLITRTGSAFILTSVASFCYQSGSIYWVGRQIGPLAATQMTLFMTILTTVGSLLIMFTQPLWPAIQDARARRDAPWIRQAYSRLARYLMAFFGIAGLTIAITGNRLIHLWVRSATQTGLASQILLGGYLLLVTWEQLNYSFLIGLGGIWFAATFYFAGALVMLSIGFWLVPLFGINGMLAALCAGPLLLTAWVYPTRLRHLFRDSR